MSHQAHNKLVNQKKLKERKAKENEQNFNLNKMKAMMNQVNQDDKLDQNAELAKLRAATSIQKTVLNSELKKDGQNN